MARTAGHQEIDWKQVELVYEDDGARVPSMLAKLRGEAAQARRAWSLFATGRTAARECAVNGRSSWRRSPPTSE